MKPFLPIAFFVLFLSASASQATDHLKACRQNIIPSAANTCVALSYTETQQELYHSAEPWQQLHYTGTGTAWYNADHFNKQDTIIDGKRTLCSKTVMTSRELLYQDYGSSKLAEVHRDMFADQQIETARYSPAFLLSYFLQHHIKPQKTDNADLVQYRCTINKIIVTLYIRTTSNLPDRITTLRHDELRGDVLTSYNYGEYRREGTLQYPASVTIEKVNGRLKDEVHVSNVSTVASLPLIIPRPADYKMAPEKEVTPAQVSVEKYSEHIYFIKFPDAGTRAMVVVFSDFLLVNEAPLNQANGERIIAEARKIAPGKPVKYFTFGHHHPHYLGGIRPFIHKGVTVLSVKEDESYLQYLASAPHTLQPDSLQRQPRPLQLQELSDSLTISDGIYAMHIYHIGQQSGHTKDYLVYYFPEEKMLFEGDLVWIDTNGPPKAAVKTQASLYAAIRELHLDVKEIVQSWGIAFDGYKMEIPFSDLEASMQVK